MNPLGLALAGVALVGLGATHRLPAVDAVDWHACRSVQKRLMHHPWIDLFRFLWPLGRSELAMLVLIGLAFFNLGLAASAAAAFIFWAVADRLIKLSFKRVRPFERKPATEMLQPRRPGDPSFPSGDAFHAWFLALSIIQVFHLPLFPALVVGVPAVLVSLGRIVMGVHYPLDVLAGAGLGLIAVASEIVLISYFHPV